jgi:hypothetical protein
VPFRLFNLHKLNLAPSGQVIFEAQLPSFWAVVDCLVAIPRLLEVQIQAHLVSTRIIICKLQAIIIFLPAA